MKAYTDLNQSKKLAEILPIESADMYYFRQIDDDYFPPNVESICPIPLFKDGREDFKYDIPCWSLSALVEVIPKRIKEYNVLRTDLSIIDFSIWYDELGYGVNTELPDITMKCPVDACYKMIVTLNELKIL